MNETKIHQPAYQDIRYKPAVVGTPAALGRQNGNSWNDSGGSPHAPRDDDWADHSWEDGWSSQSWTAQYNSPNGHTWTGQGTGTNHGGGQTQSLRQGGKAPQNDGKPYDIDEDGLLAATETSLADAKTTPPKTIMHHFSDDDWEKCDGAMAGKWLTEAEIPALTRENHLGQFAVATYNYGKIEKPILNA